MKQVREPRLQTTANAWGRDVTMRVTVYEIEQIDVGARRNNYLGHGRPPRQITIDDVGRRIAVYTMPGGGRAQNGQRYACWEFCLA